MLYSATTFIQDIFSVLVIASCLYALYRRFILHIPRLEVDKTGKLDAAFILVMIILVCVFMLGENISLVARQNFILGEYYTAAPVVPIPFMNFSGGLILL